MRARLPSNVSVQRCVAKLDTVDERFGPLHRLFPLLNYLCDEPQLIYCAGVAATSSTTCVPPLSRTSLLAPMKTPDNFDAPTGVLLASRTPGTPVVRMGWPHILPTTVPAELLLPVADPWPGPMPLMD